MLHLAPVTSEFPFEHTARREPVLQDRLQFAVVRRRRGACRTCLIIRAVRLHFALVRYRRGACRTRLTIAR